MSIFSSFWTFADLLLAVAPVVLAIYAAPATRDALLRGGARRWAVAGTLLLVWLLFLPNTAYLLTEWRHYDNRVTANPDYSLIFHGRGYSPDATTGFTLLTGFYALYTGAGLATLWAAILPLDRQAIGLLRPRAQTGARGAIFLLCAIGVYMGFVVKLNSWQILTWRTVASLGHGLVRLVVFPTLAIPVLAGAAFLWASYAAFTVALRGWRDQKAAPRGGRGQGG